MVYRDWPVPKSHIGQSSDIFCGPATTGQRPAYALGELPPPIPCIGIAARRVLPMPPRPWRTTARADGEARASPRQLGCDRSAALPSGVGVGGAAWGGVSLMARSDRGFELSSLRPGALRETSTTPHCRFGPPVRSPVLSESEGATRAALRSRTSRARWRIEFASSLRPASSRIEA